MVAKISQAQTDIITASFQKLTAQQAAEQSGASLATVKRVWAKLRASSPVPIPPRTPRARDYPDRIEPSQCAYQLTKDTTIAQLCKHIATSEEQMQSELRKAENCDDPYERSVRIRVADDYHKQMLDAIRLMAKCTGIDRGDASTDTAKKDRSVTVRWLPGEDDADR